MDDSVRPGRSQICWALIAVTALAVGFVAWWVPRAGADTALGTTGLTGNHFLFDDLGQPGAQCVVDHEAQTVEFTVAAPYVVGLDRDPGFVESTAVRWKIVLVQDGVPIDESDWQYGSAGEVSSATFDPITVASPILTGLLTVQVEIQWLDFPEMPQETVLGSSLREVDFYRQDVNDDAGPRTVEGGCRVVEEPPIPTNTPEPTSTPVPSTATNTPEPTATQTPDPTATATPEPPATSTPAPTATTAPEPTATVTPSPTLTPSPTATNAPTPMATQAPAPSSTPTPGPSPMLTPVPTATATATPVPSTAPNGPATLATSSSRGIVNSNLRLTLSGFPANAYVEISFAGATVAGLTTTPEGTVNVTVKVPAKPAGTYPLWAISGTESASATYTIAPRVKVIPGSAGPGDQVEISLRGFGRNEAVRIRWLVDGRWVQIGLVPRTSNTGSANILITVPEGAAPGLAKVRGDGTIARAQTNAFVVTE